GLDDVEVTDLAQAVEQDAPVVLVVLDDQYPLSRHGSLCRTDLSRGVHVPLLPAMRPCSRSNWRPHSRSVSRGAWRPYARDLRPARPVRCTSAACALHCSTTSTHATSADGSSSASRIPTASDRPKHGSTRSS